MSMWMGGMHVYAAPGEGKSVLLNYWGVRFLASGGAWLCNNTIDRVKIYDLLRSRGIPGPAAREAVTKRLSMWKSYDDLVAVARYADERGDRGLLITLDEADMEFGRRSQLPSQVRPVFAQCRKFGISYIAATQGSDDLSQYVLDRTHSTWRAEKWSSSMMGGFAHGMVSIWAALRGRPHIPCLFRYKKEKMHGRSTYAQSKETVGRAQLYSMLAPDLAELSCFDTHEYLQSAEADREIAEQRAKWYKALLKGDTVPVATCEGCEGTGRALQVLRVGGSHEIVSADWITEPSARIFDVMEQGEPMRWVPCELCGAQGFRTSSDHPVLAEAREMAETFGWRV